MTYVELPLWEILVPHKMGEHDNTNPDIPRRKKNIPVPYHQEWDKYVRSVTGGLTIHKAARGQWEDNTGRLYKEIMIPVRIACTQEQITQIAEHSLEYYKQKAIFVTLVSEKTLVFYADGQEPDAEVEDQAMFEVVGYAMGSSFLPANSIMGLTTVTDPEELYQILRCESDTTTYRELYQIDLDRSREWKEENNQLFSPEHAEEIMSRPEVFPIRQLLMSYSNS